MDVVTALARLQGAARREQLLARGVPARAIMCAHRAGLVERTYRGVYSLPSASPLVITARMYRGRLTCASWAEVLELPLLERDPVAHLVVPRDRALRRDDRRPRGGVHLHRSTAWGDGLLADARTALADAAACMVPRFHLALVDGALRRGLVLQRDLLALEHVSGAYRRWLYRTADPRAESFLESVARYDLLKAGMDVRLQVRHGTEERVDLTVEDVQIECDGYSYHVDKAAFWNDRRRDRLHAENDRPVLRFTYDDVIPDPTAVPRSVAAVVAARRTRIAG